MQLKSIGLAAIAAYTVAFAAWAQSDNGNVEPTKQPVDAKLVFSSLELRILLTMVQATEIFGEPSSTNVECSPSARFGLPGTLS